MPGRKEIEYYFTFTGKGLFSRVDEQLAPLLRGACNTVGRVSPEVGNIFHLAVAYIHDDVNAASKARGRLKELRRQNR